MLYFILLYIIITIELILPLCDWLGYWLVLVLSTTSYLIIFYVIGNEFVTVILLTILFTITTPYPRYILMNSLSSKLGGVSTDTFIDRLKTFFLPF